jgi:hypothetical protein
MGLFARQPPAVERLVRLLHAATLDGSIVRAKLTLHFIEAVPRTEADELADRAAARAARILGAARRATELAGCEPEVVAGVSAGLATPESRVRSVELELFTAGASSSGLRRKVVPTVDETDELEAPPAPTRAPTPPVVGSPAPPLLAAPALVLALHQAASTLADALLWQHERLARRADWRVYSHVAPEHRDRRGSQPDRDSAAALERATRDPAARLLDLMRWRAAVGSEAVDRVHEEASLAATYLLHQALASPGVPRSATTALAMAIARKAFPDAPLQRELSRYIDGESSLHSSLARAVAAILQAPYVDELTDTLVWAIPSARDGVREAVRAARG